MFIDLFQLVHIQKAWRWSKLSNKDVVSHLKTFYPNLEIGCTFVPEKLMYLNYSDEKILENFDFIVQELGIKEIRLGIRFTSIDVVKNEFGIYKDLLDYAVDNDVRLTLNVGPIKTCGWPEYHIPNDVMDECEIPEHGKCVDCDSQMAQAMRGKLEEFLEYLKSNYSKEQLQTVVFQPENEAFFQFGEQRWLIDQKHIQKVISLIQNHFPENKILLNTPETHFVKDIAQFAEQNPQTKFILGMDYYYAIGDFGKYRISKMVDQSIFSRKAGAMSFSQTKEKCRELGIETEVTELQMEPWGKASEPGNSVRSLKYGLLRCVNILEGGRQVVRVWGIEQLAGHAINGTATEEHKAMIELIKMVNGRG
jgi:hypothetical protein